MWLRFRAVFADTPIVFFAVVIGVALTFRLTVGWIRDASVPPVVAPTFVSSAKEDPKLGADPDAKPVASTSATTSAGPSVEVGAAARVQPLGSPSPLPARVAPKTRGHGRRPLR